MFYQEILNRLLEFFLTISTNAVESVVNAVFLIIAIVVFSYNFWRKSRNEGFSPIKIFDLMNLALLSGILGTFIIQQVYYYVFTNYFPLNRESFIVFPLYEVFMMINVIVTYYFCKVNQWSLWKIGDLTAISLALTQSILAIGIALQTILVNLRINDVFNRQEPIVWSKVISIEYLVIAISFTLIYFLLRQLNNNRFFSSSTNYFFRKRNTAIPISGYLFATYLLFVSLVMIIFLAYTQNTQAWAWWFQLVTYSGLLIWSISIFIYKYNQLSDREDK